MKKMKTIFDRQNREEDLALLQNDTSTKKKEKTNMLLRKYNTEIFEPDIRDLHYPGQEEIDMIMKKTKALRPAVNKTRIFSFHTFAYAASFLAVCCLIFSVLKNDHMQKPFQGKDPSGLETMKVRGIVPVKSAKSAKDQKKMNPLAYLADQQGKIEILHLDGKKGEPSSCEVLYQGDIVILTDKAKAKVMYKDALFNVSGPMRYKIEDPDPVTLDQNDVSGKRLQPTNTTRGSHLTGSPDMIMPPKTLLASVVAPITRAGNDGLNIYSPKGASFTNSPIVRIGGDPNLTYTVSILNLEGTAIGKSVTMKGKTQRAWTDFTKSPIVEDEIYTLRVQQNGKIVNDINNALFWRLSEQEKKDVDKAMECIGHIESEQERMFFRANAFCKHGCYAEAYVIIKPLTDKYPKNTLYSNLIQYIHNELKIK